MHHGILSASALLLLALQTGASEQPAPPELASFEREGSASFLDRLDVKGIASADGADQGVVVTAVDPKGLAEGAGVRVGDRLLGINGWEVDDGIDLMLLRAWLPKSRDQETLTLVRDGKRISLIVPVSSPIRGGFSWSILSRFPNTEIDLLCSLVGLTPSNRDRQLLQWLPARIGRSVLALGHREPAAVPGLKLLISTFLDLTEDRDPPPLALQVTFHDSFLSRVAGFWARVATIGDSEPTPEHLGADTWFIADFYPHPTLPPAELGPVHLTDTDLQHVLERRASGDLVATDQDQDDVHRRFGMVEDLPKDERSFLAQVAAALIDSDRQGGWPFRSELVADAQVRSRVEAGLARIIAAGGPDVVMAQLALVGALANDGRWDEAADLAITIGMVSPFLGECAVGYLRGLPEIWHSKELLDRIQARIDGSAAQPTTRHAGLYRWCKGRYPALDYRVLARGYRSDIAPILYIRGAVDVERSLEDDEPMRQLAKQQLWEMTSALNSVAWDLTRWAQPRDARAGLLLTHQLRYWMTFMPILHPYCENTIAVCYAVNGNFPLATIWSRAAGNDMAPNSRASHMVTGLTPEMREAVNQRTVLFEQGLTWSDVSPGVMVPTTVSVGGQASGGLCADQRMGPWTITRADGGKEVGWYVNGEQTGLWTTLRADGTRISEGFLWKGNRVGLWTTWTADGKCESESWFTGASATDTNHTGPWTAVYPDGKLRAQGWFILGKKEGLWRTWYDNGQSESIGSYAKDVETGPWTAFDRNGKSIPHHSVPQRPSKSDF